MSFAVPNALLLAALAAPIVVFYILKVRLRRVPTSTNLFWKQIFDEKPPRSIWQYLRHLLSLLIQLFLLALLVLAVADPYFPWQLLQARRVVAVIDNSASMQATDVAPNRFAAAIDAANKMVEGLRFRDEMAIVLAGPRPEVVLGMNGHLPTLKRTLNEIAVSDNPTELTPAIELGRRLIGDHPRGQIIVFTDGCDKSFEATDSSPISTSESVSDPAVSDSTPARTGSAPATGQASVDFRLFGTRAPNLGITQFQVRRSLIDPLGYEVLVAVTNAAKDPVQCRLEIELTGDTVDVLPLKLGPDETWSRSLEKTSLEGGRLVANITQIAPAERQSTDADLPNEQRTPPRALNVLDRDDTAWAVLPPRKVEQVLIVTEGNLFLRKVFEANPLVRVEVRQDLPAQWPAETLVVLHRQVPAQLPPGSIFVVDPAAGCDFWELGDPLENPIVTEQDQDSPLMTHVRLDNVLMPEARQLKFKAKPHALATVLSGDAVYADVNRRAGKCLVLTIDLERSDLAFRTAFPIMVTNALGWFAGTSGELRESSATGSMLVVELDRSHQQDEQRVLRSPSGRDFALADPAVPVAVNVDTPRANGDDERRSTVSLGPFDECGVWSLPMDAAGDGENGQATIEIPVNLADPRESDLRPPEQLTSHEHSEPLVASWLARPLWFYLVVVACLLTLCEWFLYQRRVIA